MRCRLIGLGLQVCLLLPWVSPREAWADNSRDPTVAYAQCGGGKQVTLDMQVLACSRILNTGGESKVSAVWALNQRVRPGSR